MKALVCLGCSTITSPPAEGGTWRHCDCGQCAIRWTDPHAGRAEVWAADRSITRLLGLHNGVLTLPASTHDRLAGNDEGWRNIHRQVCADAEGYLFHAERRECWAVITRPGDSGDVRWHDQPPDTPARNADGE